MKVIGCREGITPAYAGKRPCPQLHACPPWDHPRVCGEKGTSAKTEKEVKGSPPRMRGKVWSEANGKFRDGITPAYAGKRTI